MTQDEQIRLKRLLIRIFGADEDDRLPLVSGALGECGVIHTIVYSGNTEAFVDGLIVRLRDFGQVAPNQSALASLLDNCRHRVGVDAKAEIDTLIIATNRAQSQSSNLSPSTEPIKNNVSNKRGWELRLFGIPVLSFMTVGAVLVTCAFLLQPSFLKSSSHIRHGNTGSGSNGYTDPPVGVVIVPPDTIETVRINRKVDALIEKGELHNAVAAAQTIDTHEKRDLALSKIAHAAIAKKDWAQYHHAADNIRSDTIKNEVGRKFDAAQRMVP